VSVRRHVVRLRSLGVAALAVALANAPRAALACAVCTAGRDDENQAAFLISTIFLSLLPLAALGTLVFVLWRRFRRLEAEAGGDEREATPTALVDEAAAPTAVLPSPARS